MNIARVLKYLISGVLVGAVLFFAGFGVINLLDKSSDEMVKKATDPVISQAENTPSVEITPPEIEVNSTSTEVSTDVSNGQGTSDSPIKIKPLGSTDAAQVATDTDEESTPVAFGTLTLSTVNSTNGQPTPADFMIENNEKVAIALVKDTASSTLSLPAGNYKITVTQGPVKLVRFLGVKEGQNGSEVFELDVPVLAGEPTAPATQDTAVQSITAQSTTAAQASTEEMATEDAKADGAGRPATEASSEVTVTDQDSASSVGMGGLRVSALTKEGNRPTNASFYIQKLNGENIENVKGVSTQQFNLPAGDYRVTARKGTARVVTELTVVANRGLHEVFHIPEVPDDGNGTQANTTTRPAAAPVPRPTPAPTLVVAEQPSKPTSASEEATGRLELFAETSTTNGKAIKANFYVQTPTGELVANKTYVSSIGYKLPSGKYKVTVRASGYADRTVDLMVRDDQVRREVFKLDPINNAAPVAAAPIPVIPLPAAVSQAPAQAAPPPRPSEGISARRGGLQINIVSAQTGQGLVADISVHRPDGREVRRVNQTPSARFDLPPREFVIRVNYGGLVTNQKVDIRSGQLAIKTISFR